MYIYIYIQIHFYIYIHYITLHCIALHYITLHNITTHTYTYTHIYTHIHTYTYTWYCCCWQPRQERRKGWTPRGVDVIRPCGRLQEILTLLDRLLPCFWLLILDASFVPLHVTNTYIPNLCVLGVWKWSETHWKPHLRLQLWPGRKEGRGRGGANHRKLSHKYFRLRSF